MAWPLTPLTTYVASSTPSIKALDLNSMQNGINRILDGTYTHKALYADGIGGQTPSGGGQIRAISAGLISPNFIAASPLNHNRWAVDAFGFPDAGDVDIKHFDPYTFFSTLGGSSDAAVGGTGWLVNSGGAGTTTARDIGPAAAPLVGFPVIRFEGTSAGSNLYICPNTSAFANAGSIAQIQDNTMLLVDFKVAMNVAGAGNNVDFKLGFTTLANTGGTGAGNNWNAQNGAWFEKRTADAFWQCKSSDGTLQTTGLADDAPANDTFQNLRIVVAKANTISTAAVIFMIENKIKAVHTTRIPGGFINLVIRQDNISAVTRRLYIGRTRFALNRQLNPTAGA